MVKSQKSWSEEKVVNFRSAFLFPERKQEAVTQGGTRGIDHLMCRRTQGAGIVKDWEDKQNCSRILDTLT